ncbi:hypothetical protein AX14_012520 [Amanita brunnescens Koide BX004]|nr:hypothetical protein AX14_012520 [Amanita brunnescens Koide BX004]
MRFVSMPLNMFPSTPGLRFLAKGALNCAVPVIWGVGIQQLLNRALGAHIPTWIAIFGSLVALPVGVVIRLFLKQRRDRLDAAAMGAQIVPKVKGKRFGNLDVIKRSKEIWMTGYIGEEWGELFDTYGSMFDLYPIYTNLFFTMSPEHMKAILATDFPKFAKGERQQEVLGFVLGTGVLNSDGDMWKFHRSIARPAFARDRISEYEIFDRHAATAISQLKQRLRQGYAVNFEDVMTRFTLDSATEFLFGSCVHSLTAGLPYAHNVAPPSSFTDSIRATSSNAFAKALLEAQKVTGDRLRSGPTWPLEDIWYDRTRESMRVVDGYVEPIIQEALARKRAGMFNKKVSNEHLEEGETLLDHLVQVIEDPKVLKDELLNIMIASRDTTASTLTFIVYLLSMHPQVMTRLRQEILDKVGPIGIPNRNNIKELKYLRAVINETLRLFPAVPFNERESVNATTLPNPDPTQKPYYIPAKTKITYSVFIMQRRTDLWGPDALEFDPDRFLDDRVNKYLAKNPSIFLPFNAGPRICLGQQFAYNEISIMVVRLLQSFSTVVLDRASAPPDSLPPPDWKTSPGRKAIEQVVPKVHLIMYSGSGLWIKMEEAQTDLAHD